VYIARDIAKMKTRINTFIQRVESTPLPRQWAQSYMDMYAALCAENQQKIADYASRDRITGKFKTVNTDGIDVWV
jgi:hypothetical protein